MATSPVASICRIWPTHWPWRRIPTITTITRNECKDYDKLPGQFCDYMKSVNTRFTDICTKYLTGLTMDDIKYLKPEDFICLVPSEKYSEKLLMTIMVRKYIFCDD